MEIDANALVIMVKSPRPGSVKTRLVPPLTELEAATLYTRFIADTFKGLSFLEDIKCYLAIALDDSMESSLEFLVPDGVCVIKQRGEGLGERMSDLFSSLFAAGHRRIALIGSDSPDIPPAFIGEAFTRLQDENSKVVLGPASDGGYYLIAMSGFDARPFRAIKWSSDTVLKDTIANLDGEPYLLKPWYDIDRPSDILRLARVGRAKESLAYIEELDILGRCRKYVEGSAGDEAEIVQSEIL